jgi:DNA-binding transcriptional LysR family regulator
LRAGGYCKLFSARAPGGQENGENLERMELRHLRYFKTVAEELSFTRASALLHVAQSAVSAQVRDLEAELEVALFERNSRQVQLTAAGKIFLAGVDEVFQILEDARRKLRRIGRGDTASLAIGFIGAQSHEWMPQVLKRFRVKHPGVEVSLVEMVPSQQLEALLGRTLDIGLVGPIDGKPPPGLRFECITEENPMLGVPGDHPLARMASVPLARLRNEPFIFTSSKNSPNYRAWLSRLCHRAGFTPRVVQEVDRARTVVQYVAAGFGISIFPEHISRLPAPGVSFVPLDSMGLKIRYGIAWRRGPVSAVVTRFIEYVKEQYRSSETSSTPNGQVISKIVGLDSKAGSAAPDSARPTSRPTL